MTIFQISTEDALYQQARKLRHQLFFAPHNLPESTLDDDNELISYHFIITTNSQLAGYGRLTKLNGYVFQLSQMAISPSYQSKGLGTALLKKMMNTAVSDGAEQLTLNSRLPAARLYSKQGFKAEGEIFHSLATGIPHVKMTYNCRQPN